MEGKIVEQLLAIMEGEANVDIDVDQELYPKPEWAVGQVVRASGLVENICCHGVGHPHPASVAEFEKMGIMSMGYHGCDLCCCDEEIKAKLRKEIKEYNDESL